VRSCSAPHKPWKPPPDGPVLTGRHTKVWYNHIVRVADYQRRRVFLKKMKEKIPEDIRKEIERLVREINE